MPSWQDRVQPSNFDGMMSEMHDLPGVVDEMAAGKLTQEQIVRQVQRCKEESANARQRKDGEWKLYADLYNARDDTSGKAEWQSKCFIPQIFSKIEQAKTQILGALLQAGQWFVLETYPKLQPLDPKIQFIQQILEMELEHAGFIPEYSKCLEEGFLFGTGYLKIYWHDWVSYEPEVQQVPDPMGGFDPMTGGPMMTSQVVTMAKPRNGMKCSYIPCQSMYPDPFAYNFFLGRYVVEELSVDQEEIDEGMKVGIYRAEKNLGEPVSWDQEIDYRQRQSGIVWPGPREGRKRHLMQIYHGNFYGEDGKLALSNWRAVVLNKRTLLSFCPNPIYTGKWPYICSTPIPLRGSVWGRSLIETAAQMQIELNKLVQLFMDSARFAVLPAATVNKSKVHNLSRLQALTPGGLYEVDGDGAIQPLKISAVPQEAFPVMNYLESKIDEATRMWGAMAGEPPLKGRQTAYQVRNEMSQGRAQVSAMAKDIERHDLEPSVQLAYDLTVQLLSDTSDPELRTIIEQQMGPMELMDETARLDMLDADFKVKARGVSMMLERSEQIDKYMQLLQISMQMGMPPPQQIQIFYQIAKLMNIDPREIGYPQTMEEMMMMQQQMMMAQQQAGPGGGGGAGSDQSAPMPPSSPQRPPGPNSPQALMNQVQTMGPPGPPMM